MTLIPGTQLGSYEIVSRLGSGGMGEVYRAKDRKLGRDVALKILGDDLTASSDRLRRFGQEARAASALNHPNIVTIYEIGKEGSTPFIAMERVDGKTLRAHLNDGRPSVANALDWGTQMAEGLAEAHGAGIVHRDLKPENVMIRHDGYVKILDFGLAKLRPATSQTDAEASTLTKEGTVVGTVGYMSPEQAKGQAVDHRSDQFSFGAILYELTTGRRAFQGDSPVQTLSAIIEKEPEPMEALNADIPTHLRLVVEHCLAKDPRQRYDSTRDLARELKNIERLRQPRESSNRWVPAAVVGAVALLLAVIAGFLSRGFSARGTDPIQSLVVLPLENLSGDPEQEYFADGMTEALIADLAKISSLKVISRTSAMRYKGTKKSLPEIARELHVEAVVEGSVLRAENRVRITAQLIEAETDRHLWAESYERELRDVLRLQSEVARSIARQINLQLTPQEESALAAARVIDPEAHQAYLKGRYHWNKRDAEGLRSSITFFEEAIEHEPDYALAYAGLADAYNLLGQYNLLPSEVAFPKGLEMAEMSLRLDEDCAEAYAARAFAEMMYEWDWRAAEAAYSRALALNPGYATAQAWYNGQLVFTGRFDESLAGGKRAQQLDPLSLIINSSLARILYMAGRYDEAILQYQATLELDPDFMPGLVGLGNAYLRVARYEEAISLFQRARELSGDPGWGFDPALGHAYAKAGRRDDALRLLREKEELSRQRYVSPVQFAYTYAALDERDKAFEYLESAFAQRSVELVWLKVDPVWDPLRDDPRFQDLLQRMNFPE